MSERIYGTLCVSKGVTHYATSVLNDDGTWDTNLVCGKYRREALDWSEGVVTCLRCLWLRDVAF